MCMLEHVSCIERLLNMPCIHELEAQSRSDLLGLALDSLLYYVNVCVHLHV